MGFLGAHETLTCVTHVKGVTKEQLIASLHDHDVFMKSDPQYVSHKATTEPKKKLVVPTEIEARLMPGAETRFYECVDKVPGIAAKFMPGASTSTTYYQFTNTNDGIFIRGESSLDVVICREYRVTNGPDAGSLLMEETVTFDCSKILLGTVKGMFIENWMRFHQGYVDGCGGNATVGDQRLAFA